MIKVFCDGCGVEMKGSGERLKVTRGGVGVEVMVSVGGTWNAGAVCHDCVRRIVADSGPGALPNKRMKLTPRKAKSISK